MRGLLAKFSLQPKAKKAIQHTGYVRLDTDDIEILIDQLIDIKEQYPDATLQLAEATTR